MNTISNALPSVLVFGLERPVADAIESALQRLGFEICRDHASPADCGCEIMFCGTEDAAALLAARGRMSRLPLVVVASRLPHIPDWLDAIEAGAFDYCSAPFETRQIAWIMQSAMLALERHGPPVLPPIALHTGTPLRAAAV